jgi:hypothetical protein
MRASHRPAWLTSMFFENWPCSVSHRGTPFSTLKIPRSTIWDHRRNGPFVVKHLWGFPTRSTTWPSGLGWPWLSLAWKPSTGAAAWLELRRDRRWVMALLHPELWTDVASWGSNTIIWLKNHHLDPKSHGSDILALLVFRLIGVLPSKPNSPVSISMAMSLPDRQRTAIWSGKVNPTIDAHMDPANPHRARESTRCLQKYGIRPIDHPHGTPGTWPPLTIPAWKTERGSSWPRIWFSSKFLLATKRITESTKRAELELVFAAWERRLGELSV